jgi:hypothetical protein
MDNVIYIGPSNNRIGLFNLQNFKKTTASVDAWIAAYPAAKILFCPLSQWKARQESPSVKTVIASLLAEGAFTAEGTTQTPSEPPVPPVVVSTTTTANFVVADPVTVSVLSTTGFAVNDQVDCANRIWQITALTSDMTLDWISGDPVDGTTVNSGATVTKI